MRLSIVAFVANGEDSIEKQTNGCVEQLYAFISKGDIELKNIISINLFLLSENSGDFYKQRSKVDACLPEEIRTQIPLAYLAQAPADGKKVSMEVHLIPSLNGSEIVSKSIEGHNYMVVTKTSGEKLVIANGINAKNSSHSILEDSEWVFAVMERILQSEGLNFGSIFRQWNYIEEITAVDMDGEIENQHYQIFNNVRSKYYSKAEFTSGYPAATGIGTLSGGVVVSFYAANSKGLKVISVENPLQRAAFDYTEEVLIGDAEYEGFCKSTPKFARAKFVENAISKQIFISGTASIRDEKTIAENDVVRQTEVTIDNIEKLISEETLSAIDKNLTVLPALDFFRVYIKNPSDFRLVKETCEKRWPNITGIYVVSDVCRENLLVEIEALASV